MKLSNREPLQCNDSGILALKWQQGEGLCGFAFWRGPLWMFSPKFALNQDATSSILCKAELYLTLWRGCSEATATYCRCHKIKEQLISEKKRHVRDRKRKRTDVWGGQMPDLVSALITWGWAYRSIWELILQIESNWHGYWNHVMEQEGVVHILYQRNL